MRERVVVRQRTSPCIGVCSTTYGDLVCRGCNRFAHEVVQWNAYDDGQRATVWRRLDELRDGALASCLSKQRVAELCAARRTVEQPDHPDMSDAALAYQVLRRLAVRRLPLPWEASAAPSSSGTASSAGGLLHDIDRELHKRALAVYERSFKIPAE